MMRLGNVGRVASPYPLALVIGLGLVLVGCLPGAGPAQPSGGASGSAGTPGPRTLNVGEILPQEPKEGIIRFEAIGATRQEFMHTFHTGLTVYDARGTLLPRIAQKVPTVEDGDWKVLPDGQMEVTWKLRPNVKWHDGVPATAGDFALGVQVIQDPEFPQTRSDWARLITDVATPDASTVVVRWKQPYLYGNASGPNDIPGMPRHLLGELYGKGDKSAFFNSPLWTREFVGLGPYRLSEWVEGSLMQGLAFDDYFLGRPRIDRVIFRYTGDANVLVLSLLSGAFDMTMMGNLSVPQLNQIKQAWEPSGAGSTFLTYSGTRSYSFQFRNPEAPWADVRVRRALAHMLERPVLVDAIFGPLVSVADTFVSPTDPIHRLLEQRGLARYLHDPAQADRLMAEAGWVRPPGGSYRSADGRPFTLDLTYSDSPENITEATAVAGQWKAAGVADLTHSPIPNEATTAIKNEMRHNFSGVQGSQTRDDIRGMPYTTSQMGTADNRWTGGNRGGYSNPEFDRLYDRALVTLDLGQRQDLMADFLKVLVDDVAMINIFYDPGQATGAVRKGIRGPGGGTSLQLNVSAWNIHEWEMD